MNHAAPRGAGCYAPAAAAPSLSRRRFAGVLGGALGLAAVRTFAATTREAPAGAVAIDLSSNENPYGPSPAALEAMARSQVVAGRYPDAAEKETIEAIARLHGVGPDRIVLGCGSSEILRLCDAAFLSPGRTVVAAEPTFEAVLHYAKVTKAEPVKVPLTADFRHDLPAMARACDARAGLVYVCNPNNPTGTIVTGDEILAFLAQVPPTAVVVVDEAYHHFVETPAYRSALETIDRFPNVVVARTFSKVYGMAGMRLGYAVASAANAEALRAQAAWSNANVAVLAAARASLADEGLVARQRDRLNGTRRWLSAELARDGRRTIPSETNFLMIDAGGDVKPLIAAFEARAIRVGRRFEAMPTWLRVTIGTPEETQAFLAALRALLPARAAAA
jgi:histidinol-phosphate aminotransferase